MGGDDDQISNGQLLNSNTDSTHTGVIVWRERTDLCSLFLEGICPHGITGKKCSNFHPRVCNAYRKNGGNSKYGCKKGNNCERFHPKVCPSSLKSRTCYNENCRFKWHLPRTIRVPQNKKHYMYIYKSQGYRTPNNHRRTDYYSNNRKRRYAYNNSERSNYRPSVNSHTNGYYDHHPSGTCDFNESGGGDSGTGYYDQNFDASHAHPISAAAPYNVNQVNQNNSFPFLARTLQDSIAKNIQEALKELNVRGQIQTEIAKFQRHLPQESLEPTQETVHQLQSDVPKFPTHLPQETLIKQTLHNVNYQPPSNLQRPHPQQDTQLNVVGCNEINHPSYTQEPMYPSQRLPPMINIPPFHHQVPLHQHQ